MNILFSSVCFIFYLHTGLAASGAPKKLAGALHGSVTFPLNHAIKQMDTIIWSFESNTILTIQSNTSDTVIVSHTDKERVTFIGANYSLTLRQLKKNDSGTYRVRIQTSSTANPFTHEYHLQVYEHLPKPTVRMSYQSNQNGTCVTNLTCSVGETDKEVTYSWKSRNTNESYYGPVLNVSWSPEHGDEAYICVARNPVSINSSNHIFVQKLCIGDFDSSMAVVVVFPILFLFVLIALLFLCKWIRKGRETIVKETKQKMDSPSMRESTVYETVSNVHSSEPETNQCNTFYATVQVTSKMERPCSTPATSDTTGQLAYGNII